MPIIEIQALIDQPPAIGELLKKTAQAAADALGIELKRVWATFKPIEAGAYLEGGVLRQTNDALEVAPIVDIRALHGRPADKKRACLEAVARAVGQGLGVDPDNVFVEYREIPSGHVFTGGAVRE